jgi:hypothetical protein
MVWHISKRETEMKTPATTAREPLFIRPKAVAIPVPQASGTHPDDNWFV